MIISNIHEAKTNLSKLIEKVLEGKEVVIAKAGKPIIKLSKFVEKSKKRKFGALKGSIWMSDGFNDEDPEINEMFYGGDELDFGEKK